MLWRSVLPPTRCYGLQPQVVVLSAFQLANCRDPTLNILECLGHLKILLINDAYGLLSRTNVQRSWAVALSDGAQAVSVSLLFKYLKKLAIHLLILQLSLSIPKLSCSDSFLPDVAFQLLIVAIVAV